MQNQVVALGALAGSAVILRKRCHLVYKDHLLLKDHRPLPFAFPLGTVLNARDYLGASPPQRLLRPTFLYGCDDTKYLRLGTMLSLTCRKSIHGKRYDRLL